MSQTPKLEEVIEMAVDERLDHVYTAMPGRVEEYDPEFQSVSVKPLVTFERIAEDGARVADSLPVIGGVPVVFPGSGPYSITWPIEKGTTGLIVFANCSLDQWLSLGDEVNPASDRRHSLADAIFIPGLRPFASPIRGGEGVNHGPNGGNAMILKGAEIKIGGDDADDPVMRKSDFDDFLLEYFTHIHSGVTTGPGSSAAPVTTYEGPACSQVVKVK